MIEDDLGRRDEPELVEISLVAPTKESSGRKGQGADLKGSWIPGNGDQTEGGDGANAESRQTKGRLKGNQNKGNLQAESGRPGAWRPIDVMNSVGKLYRPGSYRRSQRRHSART